MPVYLLYCGGHTGRFSGGQGLNLQNLGRSGDGLRIRNLLKPAPGCRFVVADFAQIEARGLAWLAGERSLLDAFAKGRDVYCEFASSVFGETVRKPTATDDQETAERMKQRRQIGKQAILGLGFGMGGKRFLEELQSDPLAAGLFASADLTPSRVRGIVDAYRERYPCIKVLWATCESRFGDAILERAHEETGIGFLKEGEAVLVRLPSGRALRYPDARLESKPRDVSYLDEDGSEAVYRPEGDSVVFGRDTGLYGGKIVENIVQATARDVLVEAILRLEAAGYRVVLHVHDEVVVEVPEEEAQAALEAITRIMEEVPDWLEGCPLDSEVDVADRYGK